MLFRLFSRNNPQKEINVLAPLTGSVLPLSLVPDPVFSQDVLGKGVAISPTDGLLTSPLTGRVTHLFPTHHAIAITSDCGLELLLHIGIDTVKRKGEGFSAVVSTGDRVTAGDALIRFDRMLLQKAGFSLVTPVILTNPDAISRLEVTANEQVTAGKDTLMRILQK